LQVLRRPGQASITATYGVIAVGGGTTLRCTAVDVGSPEAEYRWLTPSAIGTSSEQISPIYTLEHATLADNGEYRCIPFNRIGDGVESVFTLQVIEPPKITRPLPEFRVLDSDESSVTLSCEAQGYPVPQIQWYKNGKAISGGDSSHLRITSEHRPSNCPPGDFCSVKSVSFLKFAEPLTWTDKGNYSCIAGNGLEKFATSSTTLSVVHAPVVLNERYPNDALAAADPGSTARIVCHISARPEPKFIWLRNGSELSNGGSRYRIRSTRLDGKIDEFQSILEVADSMVHDYGPYICRSSNGNEQKTDLVIKLQTKSKLAR
uniref:Ig-like domain-containing protein n=1 Tax=Gongylonema pulchrum TaxID=637853 RepID=A0A183EAJ4_9BILA